ncbi:nucleotidyltransferase domain-containing protein [Microbacterium sp. DT81.1]|uniref:nucleotidyltransferase domain-containing protein n=1 Tax=Microbacterium sp. DT81.1 TaxID=3393413 RepID=UPI003CF90B23
MSGEPMMSGGEVVALFRSFRAAGIRAWAGGGWAVDALVGRQTREHGDLDLAVDSVHLMGLLDLLDRDGFSVTVDWAPSRLELTAADGRVVDIHPVAFGADGSGVQTGLGGGSFHYAADGFSIGTIEGVPIPCLSVDQQLRFREGYAPRPVDVHDVALLTELARGRGQAG